MNNTDNNSRSTKTKQYKWPKTFNGWINLLARSKANELPSILQDLILWKAYTSGFWGVDWKEFHHKLDVTLTNKIAASKNILNECNYQYNVNKAITLTDKARYNNWERYASRLILSHQNAIHLNERYLSTLEPPKTEASTLMIDGDLGTGKSQWFYNKYIKTAQPQQSIIVVVPRRSLAKIAASRYKIVDYEDAKNDKSIKDVSKMSICVNSILMLINSDKVIDVLFLDEFDLTIHHLLGNAVPDNLREELIFHFLEIIRNAKHVVCAQNLLSDLALSVLEQAGRKNILKVVNDYQPWRHLNVDFFKQKRHAIDRLLEVVESNTPFLCPCNSSGQATGLFLSVMERFPDKKILLLTLDTVTGDRQTKFINAPNQQANQYTGIIFSPVMESGVEIVKESLKMKKERFHNQVCQAKILSKTEYDQLHKKRVISHNEHWAIKRYELETELCVNLDDLESHDLNKLLVFWREGRILNTIHAFETAMLSKDQAIAIAEYLLSHKAPDHQDHQFFLQWIIRAGIMESLQLSFSNGILLYNPDYKFTYNQLQQEWWCNFARENPLAINAANLGARIKTEITNQVIGHWIMGMGIKLKRGKIPAKFKHQKRRSGRYSINIHNMTLFIEVIKRRHNNKCTKYYSLLQQLQQTNTMKQICNFSLSSICATHGKKYSA